MQGGPVVQAAAQEVGQDRLDLDQVAELGVRGGQADSDRLVERGGEIDRAQVLDCLVLAGAGPGRSPRIGPVRDDGGEGGEQQQGGLQGGVEFAVAVFDRAADQPGRVRARPAGLQLGQHCGRRGVRQDGQHHGQRQRVAAQQGDQFLQRVPFRGRL